MLLLNISSVTSGLDHIRVVVGIHGDTEQKKRKKKNTEEEEEEEEKKKKEEEEEKKKTKKKKKMMMMMIDDDDDDDDDDEDEEEENEEEDEEEEECLCPCLHNAQPTVYITDRSSKTNLTRSHSEIEAGDTIYISPTY